MTYFELVDAVRAAYANADASEIAEHIAFQFNIEGEGEGAFYLEIKDGKINIEPYEYFDRDVLITTTAETLLKIGTGKLDPIAAYTLRKIKVDGNLDKALVLKKISPKPSDIKVPAAADSAAEACADAKEKDLTDACTCAGDDAKAAECDESEDVDLTDADGGDFSGEDAQGEDAANSASTTAKALSARRSGRKGKRKRGK